MPEGLSFFTLSVSPDRVKEKQLCALCASVVNKRLSERPETRNELPVSIDNSPYLGLIEVFSIIFELTSD